MNKKRSKNQNRFKLTTISIEKALKLLLLFRNKISANESQIKGFASFIGEKGWDLFQNECLINREKINDSIRQRNLVCPNLKRGENCDVKLDWSKPRDVLNIQVETDAPGLDVCYDGTAILIKGKPSRVGGYNIRIIHRYDDYFNLTNELIIECKVDVIANPKDLWEDKPTPQDIEYYKPDHNIQDQFGVKKIVAASQRGRSHAHEAKPRDDDFSIFYDEESRWHILAVADGAGSATFSREGARIACETVKEFCLHALKSKDNRLEATMTSWAKEKSSTELKKKAHTEAYNILGNAAFSAFQAIDRETKDKGRSIKLYATTLLLSICKKTSYGWIIASFWVGDGGIGLYDKEKKYLHLMGIPDGGEYAGQTRFLTNHEIFVDAINRIRVDTVEDFTALILMSDGITDPKFETDANLQNIDNWNKLWDDINAEVNLNFDSNTKYQLLRWMDFWSIGNHDDRTLAMIF